jgi:phage antirepressor YoqD-like protein
MQLAINEIMTSNALLAIINKYRLEAGENELRRNDFIERLSDELEGLHYNCVVVKNQNGTESTIADLTQDQCLLVSMRESKIVRRKILDYINYLQKPKQIQLPDFSNPAAAARAWADEVEAKQAALLQLEAAKPALEFVDRYVDSTGLKGFRQVAKLLNIKEPDLRAFLDDKQIMYKLAGEWVPYANHIDAGRFSVKAGTADNGHAFNSAKFTPKGIQWLAGEIAKSKVDDKLQLN